jgi:hypothetical protein
MGGCCLTSPVRRGQFTPGLDVPVQEEGSVSSGGRGSQLRGLYRGGLRRSELGALYPLRTLTVDAEAVGCGPGSADQECASAFFALSLPLGFFLPVALLIACSLLVVACDLLIAPCYGSSLVTLYTYCCWFFILALSMVLF